MNMLGVVTFLIVASCATTAASAMPACSVSSGATLPFGPVVALATTGNVGTNSGSSLWISCSPDVAAAPTLYSSTDRVLMSGATRLPFQLSLATAGGVELPAQSPGAPLPVAMDGTNHTVILYGQLRAADFTGLPSGVYTQSIDLTIEY